jgi:hypothetical protein
VQCITSLPTMTYWRKLETREVRLRLGRPRHRSVTHICTCAGRRYILYGKYKSTRLRVMTWESLRGE